MDGQAALTPLDQLDASSVLLEEESYLESELSSPDAEVLSSSERSSWMTAGLDFHMSAMATMTGMIMTVKPTTITAMVVCSFVEQLVDAVLAKEEIGEQLDIMEFARGVS